MSNLIRRTRDTRYYAMPDGTVKAVRNFAPPTEYSLVISQPIEYSKKRAPRAKKTLPTRAPTNEQGPSKITAEIRSAREKVNKLAAKATRVFPPINLDSTAVPKPKPLKTQKRLSEWKQHGLLHIAVII